MNEQIIDEINRASILSLDDAFEFKYSTQGKLLDLWLNHKIDTQTFLYDLTKMYEKILDELVGLYFPKDQICIMAYGKFGAEEINFSSDIDISFIFKSIADEEKIIKAARKFINETTERKGQRFLWRIDIELRPGGRSSPVAVSDSFFLWYYLNLGQVDDRYALLRARPVAGNIKIGQDLLKELEPFVFRKYVDFSVIERLKEIKLAISRHIKRDEKVFDVKFSEGGIREIEFVVFVNQLIFGGKDERLRQKRTSLLLDIIQDYLSEEKNKTPSLKECYLFLREIESLIQVNEEQRFTLEKKDMKRILSFYGISREEFSERLKIVRDRVSEIFKQTFEIELPDYKIITENVSDYELEKYLSELGYLDLSSAKEIVRNLLSKTLFLKEKKRKGILEFEIKTEGVLVSEKLVSAIVWYCSRTHDKNLALSYFSSFINAVGRRKGIYYMLSKNERLVEILAKLFGVSRLAANYLINHPESIDTIFLASQISHDLPDEVEFWESVKSGEFDFILDELRKMKKEKILLLLLDDVSKSLSHEEISERICSIYDFFLRQTLSLSAREKLKINLPPPHLNIPFYIIALGKYGSKEAIYGSDVDLVFVFSEPDPEKWIRFSQKFIVFLTASTKEGYGLQVDMRLRPSGHAGPLALSFEAFWEFYLNKADIWQRLSLLKSRVVFGGDKKHEFGSLLNEIKKLAFENIDLESIISAMRDLRKKSLEKLSFKFENGKKLINLKYCLGGMQDVEFITFFVLLKEGKFELDFKQGVIFASYFFPKIKSAYDVLRKIEKYLKIRSDIPLEDIWIQEDDGVFWDELKDFSGVSYKDFLEAKKVIASAFREIFGEL